MDTIAIVDDDLISIDTIQTLLKNDRYSFLRAYNGKDAQNLLNIAGNQVKSIILDWMMPKMDGIDLLRWIKAQPHLKNIPVVMLTANDTMEHIR
ncbi:MAG TPA: response regulator, partial [Spirochaetes bacterium]|nr:response regulator [Spirochaetota bacterium]